MAKQPEQPSKPDLDTLDPRFIEFIQKSQFLVVDPHSSSRNALRRLCLDLGAKSPNVNAVDNLGDAHEMISKLRPQFLIVEYEMGGGRCGMDLIHVQRKWYEKDSERVFLLLTSNQSPAILSHAEEEEVDSILPKPFTAAKFRDQLLAAIAPKFNPTPYLTAIQDGKTALVRKNFPDAIAAFRKARKLDPKPTAACFYEGVANRKSEKPDDAAKCFERGLTFDPKNFRCLEGLYEISMERKDPAKSYALTRLMYAEHPYTPRRIPELVKLSIANKKFKDVLDYYKFFVQMEARDEATCLSLAAGLVLTGRNYLLKGKKKAADKAVDCFDKAVSISKGKAGIYKGVLRALLETKHPKQAEAYLKALPSDLADSEEIMLLWFDQTLLAGSTNDVLMIGSRLLSKGIKNEKIYESMIVKSLEAGRRHSTVEHLFIDACRIYPEKREYFENLMKTKPIPQIVPLPKAKEAGDDSHSAEIQAEPLKKKGIMGSLFSRKQSA